MANDSKHILTWNVQVKSNGENDVLSPKETNCAEPRKLCSYGLHSKPMRKSLSMTIRPNLRCNPAKNDHNPVNAVFWMMGWYSKHFGVSGRYWMRSGFRHVTCPKKTYPRQKYIV